LKERNTKPVSKVRDCKSFTKLGTSSKAVIVTAVAVKLVKLIGLKGLVAELVEIELKCSTVWDKAYSRPK